MRIAFIVGMNPRMCKMKRMLRSDWLHERVRTAHLARSGFPALVPKVKVLFFGHMINPFLTKLVRSKWLNIKLVMLCVFIDLDFISVKKNAERTWPLSSHLDLSFGQ